jgi:hypothetical protein
VRILAINCGSSSIECAVIESDSGTRTCQSRVEDVGRDEPWFIAGETRLCWPRNAPPLHEPALHREDFFRRHTQ